jgi:hypothetical protein
MQKNFILFLFILSTIGICLNGNAQAKTEYDQLVYVNAGWKNQPDINPQLKLNPSKPLNEQQLVQLHLNETEKLLRARDVSNLSPVLKSRRAKNLDVLHQYMLAGIFPSNTRHQERQPYFIDDNGVHCAVGYLMKESGADDIASDIKRNQNYSFLADINHKKLMSWVARSGLTFDELALIQPGYGSEWCAAITEMHYNNTGTDVNEYIEIHQSSGGTLGMANFDVVRFYDGGGTLYKTLPITDMQSFNSPSGMHQFYYYTFPTNESFADEGRIEIIGNNSWIPGHIMSTTTYTSTSVQVQDFHFSLPPLASRTFNIGESEATPINFSLNYTGFYLAPSWSLSSLAATPGALNPLLVLPVSLRNFSYTINNKKVELNWETVTENNNKEFVVERSFNGTSFETIGTLPGAVNSSVVKRYTFTDNNPNYINHYRLKQVNVDGKIAYSEILYVKVEKASPLQVIETAVTTDLRYYVSSGMNGSRIEIYDISGRSFYKNVAKEGVQQINVSGWSAGKYLIRLLAVNGQVYTNQFIKQ